jgi:hypothetical protein
MSPLSHTSIRKCGSPVSPNAPISRRGRRARRQRSCECVVTLQMFAMPILNPSFPYPRCTRFGSSTHRERRGREKARRAGAAQHVRLIVPLASRIHDTPRSTATQECSWRYAKSWLFPVISFYDMLLPSSYPIRRLVISALPWVFAVPTGRRTSFGDFSRSPSKRSE